MKNIRHQRLESHILDTGNILGTLEILRGAVRSSLSRVVDQVLQHSISRRKDVNTPGEDSRVGGTPVEAGSDLGVWGTLGVVRCGSGICNAREDGMGDGATVYEWLQRRATLI